MSYELGAVYSEIVEQRKYIVRQRRIIESTAVRRRTVVPEIGNDDSEVRFE